MKIALGSEIQELAFVGQLVHEGFKPIKIFKKKEFLGERINEINISIRLVELPQLLLMKYPLHR